MNFRYILSGILFILVTYCRAQEAGEMQSLLTLNEAVNSALEQNFDIRIAQNELQQAHANNTIGNAGMLPEVTLNGGLNGSVSDTKLELASGQVQNRDGATSRGLTGSVLLNWTLFDGMRMFINKKRLDEIERTGGIALKEQVQSTVASVINAYAAVVRQKQQLVAIDTAMALAKVRMDIARRKFEIGTSAKTDYLQAQVDYNASRAAHLTQEAALRQAKDSLMITMGRDQFADYDVLDSLYLNKALTFKDKQSWLAANFSYQLAGQQKMLAEYDWQLARGAQLPLLNLAGSYNYSKVNSGAGVTLFNRTYGPQGALNLSIPVFSGFNLQRQKRIARQEIARQELIVDQLSTSLAARYRTAWRSYDNALKGLDLEQENIKYAQENVMIQQARFRVGVANTLELREAESSYVAALARLSDAAYNVKISETSLLQLENALVK